MSGWVKDGQRGRAPGGVVQSSKAIGMTSKAQKARAAASGRAIGRWDETPGTAALWAEDTLDQCTYKKQSTVWGK